MTSPSDSRSAAVTTPCPWWCVPGATPGEWSHVHDAAAQARGALPVEHWASLAHSADTAPGSLRVDTWLIQEDRADAGPLVLLRLRTAATDLAWWHLTGAEFDHLADVVVKAKGKAARNLHVSDDGETVPEVDARLTAAAAAREAARLALPAPNHPSWCDQTCKWADGWSHYECAHTRSVGTIEIAGWDHLDPGKVTVDITVYENIEPNGVRTWGDESPHMTMSGLSECEPLTAEETSSLAAMLTDAGGQLADILKAWPPVAT